MRREKEQEHSKASLTEWNSNTDRTVEKEQYGELCPVGLVW